MGILSKVSYSMDFGCYIRIHSVTLYRVDLALDAAVLFSFCAGVRISDSTASEDSERGVWIEVRK